MWGAVPAQAAVKAETGVAKPGVTDAHLKGRVSQPATWWFEYGKADTLGTETPHEVKAEAGTVNAKLENLEPGTVYHYRLVAETPQGRTTGDTATFTTELAKEWSHPEHPHGKFPPGNALGLIKQGVMPAPVLAERVVIGRNWGKARVRVPGSRSWVDLAFVGELPVGSRIDAREAKVTLVTATPTELQVATFRGGVFEVRQARTAGGLTDIFLRGEPPSCSRKSATASVRRKRRRRLWASDNHGDFRTHGMNSVATVRGTRWYTEDTCRGTVTKVTEGAVSVFVKATGRRVLVRAGERHVAPRR